MNALADRLLQVIDGFADRRVTVLGDLVVDEFVHGDIARISREAPVLILEQRDSVVVPGGGGNAIVNLRALGARPVPVGVVGHDDWGRRLLGAFRERGIPVRGISRVRQRQTPCKSRILAGGVHTRRQQIVRIDRGAGHGPLPPDEATAMRSRLEHALERSDGLLIADYGYGAADPGIANPCATSAIERGLPVTVDSRARVLEFRGLTACTPNQEELERALDLPPLAEADVDSAGTTLLRRTRHRSVLVTRGARGMVLYQRRSKPVVIPAFGSDEVADVTGAGDTVIATFTLALIAGASDEEAARLANYAAGIVVMKAGTATLSRDELRDALIEDLT